MRIPSVALALASLAGLVGHPVNAEDAVNPAIRYDRFLTVAATVSPEREKRLVSEEQFIRMAAEPGTLVLDARSRDRFECIHVKGAVNLPFTDFTEGALAKVIPDKTTRILIYCNNNFENEPKNFGRKEVSVALNIQTYINLHAYGYTNVYELGPLLDIRNTRIPFEGSDVLPKR